MFSLVPHFLILTFCHQQLCTAADTKASLRPVISNQSNEVNAINEKWSCSKHRGGKCGDDMCRCIGHKACCVNQYLKPNYIPRLPSIITWVNFTGYHLPHITQDTIQNLTHLKLTHLVLRSNHIKSCGTNVFRELKYLINFHLQYENITISNLKMCIMSIKSPVLQNFSLECLDLDTRILPSDFFSGMENNPVSNFNMDGTYIETYNQSTFSVLQHVKELHLAGCKLKQCILTTSDKLEYLILSNNHLTHFPAFCLNGEAVFPNLKYLIIDMNFIESVHPTDLACMQSLTRISLSQNPLRTVISNLVSSLPKLSVLKIEYIDAKYAQLRMNPYAFNSSSLKSLYIAKNRLHFDGIQVDMKVFHYCRLLETLYMENNDVSRTTEEMFEELLSSVRNLRKLSLSETGLTYLPRAIPIYLGKIETLYVDTNIISSWPLGYFYNLTALRVLDLGNNHITTIDSSSFSHRNLEKIKWINLNKNTYACTCELLWFIKYLKLKKHYKKFRYFPEEYICASPPWLEKKQIMDMDLSEKFCIITKQVSVIIISSITCVVILILLISAVYRYRWNLRYIFFMARFRHIRYQRLLHRENYRYDIYLSCSDEDCDFILDEIVPKLENDLGFRLYIPLRDGVGDKIDGIMTNLYDSQKVVLAVSTSYIKDQYCEFEARLAYDQSIHKRRDLMTVILLQEVDAGYMSKTLHKILDVDKYIKWGWEEESVQLFWLKLTTFLKNMDDFRP